MTEESSPAPSENMATCASYIRALADPIRLKVIQALQAGPLSVSDVSTLLEIDMAKASHHMRVLFHAKLVTTVRQGKYVYYRIDRRLQSGSPSKGRLDFGCCQFELPSKPQAADNRDQ